MLVKVQKWGNSRAIRIPESLAVEAGLELGQEVKLAVVNGQLRIIPAQEFYYELEELVAGITPENRHEEWDIGPPVGKEVW